jgi:uncharacterized protein
MDARPVRALSEAQGPVLPGPSGRIQSLDTLRGFALFGIILVNAPFFGGPMGGLLPVTLADEVSVFTVTAIFVGKFFLIFSFLFGFGFATILTRRTEGERPIRGRFLRRLLALFVFGALHALLLFLGDILMLYAVLGLVLWTCRGLSLRVLGRAAATIHAVGILLQVGGLALIGEVPGGATAGVTAGQGYLGGFAEVLAARLAELPLSLSFIALFNGFPALSMFLVGLALGRFRMFPPPPESRGIWAARGRLALIGGLSGSALSTAALSYATSEAVQVTGVIGFCAVAPVLSFGMAMTVLDWAERSPKSQLAAWLAAAGRGSLTGYVLHSVILGAVFYGWGLGLYGALGPTAVAAVGLATFVAIVTALNLWQQWFRYGPDEWLLRSIADLEWKPMRNRRGG